MNVFTLFGEIAIQNDAANKAIANTIKSAENASSKINKAFSKIGSAAIACGKVVASGMAVGAAAMGALLKSSIGEYAEYEQLVGGIETLFKDSKGKVMKYANEAYKTAGLSANDYMSTVTSFSASLLQGLGGDTEKAAEIANMAITDMSDNANKMGTAMSSIQDAYQGFAKQNYTMLDNLKLGYGGTQAEMARLINDSGVLGDAITVTADTVNQVPFNKIIEAIHIVQTEMDITGTTAKEASTTISGSFATFKATWKNFLTGLADENADMSALYGNMVDAGETVLKNVTDVLPTIKENTLLALDELAQDIDTGMRTKVWPKIQELFKVQFNVDVPDFDTTCDAISTWFGDVSEWWKSNSTYEKLKDIFTWTLGKFVDPEENGWVTALQTWWKSKGLPTVESVTQWTFGELFLPAWVDLVENVTEWWDKIKPNMANSTPWYISVMNWPTWEDIKPSVVSWWNTIKEKLSALCTFYATYDINRTYSQAELDAVDDWTIDTTAGATTPVKVGSDANGLYRVPYDGYLTRLHKDEAVLNRLDAREWRAANAFGGMNANTGRLESLMGYMIGLMQQVVANTGAGRNMVLDTGVLVGQLAPSMDMQLGTLASRKGRG